MIKHAFDRDTGDPVVIRGSTALIWTQINQVRDMLMDNPEKHQLNWMLRSRHVWNPLSPLGSAQTRLPHDSRTGKSTACSDQVSCSARHWRRGRPPKPLRSFLIGHSVFINLFQLKPSCPRSDESKSSAAFLTHLKIYLSVHLSYEWLKKSTSNRTSFKEIEPVS